MISEAQAREEYEKQHPRLTEDEREMKNRIIALSLRIQVLTDALEAAAPHVVTNYRAAIQVYAALGRPVGEPPGD